MWVFLLIDDMGIWKLVLDNSSHKHQEIWHLLLISPLRYLAIKDFPETYRHR